VQNISNRIKTVHTRKSEIDSTVEFTKSTWFEDPAPIHNFYREWFNLIDLADGYWYEVEDHHRNERWKSKMILTICKYFIINVWVLSTCQEFSKWRNFRTSLASDLAGFQDS
jgi:hypothetical protein